MRFDLSGAEQTAAAGHLRWPAAAADGDDLGVFAHQHDDLAVPTPGHLPQEPLLEFQAVEVRNLPQQEGFYRWRLRFGG